MSVYRTIGPVCFCKKDATFITALPQLFADLAVSILTEILENKRVFKHT